jgi:hypothetical protein
MIASRRLLNHGIGNRVDAYVVFAVPDECFHRVLRIDVTVRVCGNFRRRSENRQSCENKHRRASLPTRGRFLVPPLIQRTPDLGEWESLMELLRRKPDFHRRHRPTVAVCRPLNPNFNRVIQSHSRWNRLREAWKRRVTVRFRSARMLTK